MPVLLYTDLFQYLYRVEELIFCWRIDWLTISCLSQSHFESIKMFELSEIEKLQSCIFPNTKYIAVL